MPGRPHHTEKFKSCVEKVVADGKDEGAAYAICTTSLQDAGHPIFEGAASRSAEEMKFLSEHPQARAVHLRGALGATMTEMWEGREHLVIPCVALQEGVIHAVNAETPEYVGAAALSKAAATWNGRPVVLGHPTKNGRQCSANSPEVLASHGFGFIRAGKMNGTRLGMEVLVDPARLEVLGQQALLADLRAGKQVEVSVGAHVVTKKKESTWNGKRYMAEWDEINGDHLAFLPGGRGACSIEMGCGAHRAASYLVTAEGFEAQVDVKALIRSLMPRGWGDDEVKQDLREALYLVDPSARNGEVVRVTNDKVIYCVYPPVDAAGVYPSVPVKMAYWSRDYSFDTATQRFTVSGERTAVEPTTHYEAIRGARAGYKDCPSCEGSGNVGGNPCETCDGAGELKVAGAQEGHPFYGNQYTEGQTVRFDGKSADDKVTGSMDVTIVNPHSNKDKVTDVKGTGNRARAYEGANRHLPTATVKSARGTQFEAFHHTLKSLSEADLKAACRCEHNTEDDMNKTERIAALAKNEHNPTKSVKALEALDDNELKVLEEHCVKAAKAAADLKAAQDAAAALDVRLKAAEAQAIPAEELTELRTLAAERKAQDAAAKATIVGQLKTAAQGVYGDEELNGMSLPALMKLAQVARVETPNYSGKGVPVPRNADNKSDFTPPDPYEAGIKALKAREETVN